LLFELSPAGNNILIMLAAGPWSLSVSDQVHKEMASKNIFKGFS
jgi:hypothetical protein